MEVDADVYVCGNAVLVRCRGRIVFGDEPMRIARRVQATGTTARRIVLDLGALETLAAGHLGSLIIYYLGARAAGYNIALTRVPDHVMAVLNATGTTAVFEIHDSPHAAGLRLPDDDAIAAAS